MELKKETIEQEIKKEFQLERMILFSDAVFAIVITLMAIEIRLPEFEGKITEHEFLLMLQHQGRNFMAYAISFFFIGVLWTRHLKLFSVLNDYDTGLIIRNLLFLFFVGLFPFCASVISHVTGFYSPYYLYFTIILCCLMMQYLLLRYVTITKPQLRTYPPNDQELLTEKFSLVALVGFIITFILAVCCIYYIEDKEDKVYGLYIFILYAISLRIIKRKFFKGLKSMG
ncbi:hypothetical protein A5893_08170 [Pedobacter psychrophilus]|uniref:DUF1211 domain-containing membrane protein n=1 Tax=Pedobacter psychrophilus TaxID=1826909 RepID=A0A179DEV7_9SPHI|nr:TMEM175 family protein [Pedobacter psychrophilus]OAQ39561.1 hypothetical protein A5893_08170 [Pedobacter psychrophilus]